MSEDRPYASIPEKQFIAFLKSRYPHHPPSPDMNGYTYNILSPENLYTLELNEYHNILLEDIEAIPDLNGLELFKKKLFSLMEHSQRLIEFNASIYEKTKAFEKTVPDFTIPLVQLSKKILVSGSLESQDLFDKNIELLQFFQQKLQLFANIYNQIAKNTYKISVEYDIPFAEPSKAYNPAEFTQEALYSLRGLEFTLGQVANIEDRKKLADCQNVLQTLQTDLVNFFYFLICDRKKILQNTYDFLTEQSIFINQIHFQALSHLRLLFIDSQIIIYIDSKLTNNVSLLRRKADNFRGILKNVGSTHDELHFYSNKLTILRRDSKRLAEMEASSFFPRIRKALCLKVLSSLLNIDQLLHRLLNSLTILNELATGETQAEQLFTKIEQFLRESTQEGFVKQKNLNKNLIGQTCNQFQIELQEANKVFAKHDKSMEIFQYVTNYSAFRKFFKIYFMKLEQRKDEVVKLAKPSFKNAEEELVEIIHLSNKLLQDLSQFANASNLQAYVFELDYKKLEKFYLQIENMTKESQFLSYKLDGFNESTKLSDDFLKGRAQYNFADILRCITNLRFLKLLFSSIEFVNEAYITGVIKEINYEKRNENLENSIVKIKHHISECNKFLLIHGHSIATQISNFAKKKLDFHEKIVAVMDTVHKSVSCHSTFSHFLTVQDYTLRLFDKTYLLALKQIYDTISPQLSETSDVKITSSSSESSTAAFGLLKTISEFHNRNLQVIDMINLENMKLIIYYLEFLLKCTDIHQNTVKILYNMMTADTSQAQNNLNIQTQMIRNFQRVIEDYLNFFKEFELCYKFFNEMQTTKNFRKIENREKLLEKIKAYRVWFDYWSGVQKLIKDFYEVDEQVTEQDETIRKDDSKSLLLIKFFQNHVNRDETREMSKVTKDFLVAMFKIDLES